MSYMKGDWDDNMDANLLRGLQNKKDPNNEPSPANGTVAILIVLLALFCFLWAPRNLRRCSGRSRSGNNVTTDGRHPSSLASGDALSPQEVEIALVESSLRNMMASMSTMMEAQAWGNSLGINMSSGDRREYIENVLMTKKVVVMPHGESPLEQAPDGSKGDLMITAPPSTSDMGDEHDSNTNDGNNHGEDQEQCAICLVEYEAGDEISWSHNKSCTHAFHRECIIDWLISHDECPCCRHPYLSLCDDDDDNNVDEGGGGVGAAAATAAAATEEGRNRTRAPIPVPVARDQGDQLARGLQMLYEFARVPGFPSHALVGSPNDGANLVVGGNERVVTPVGDAVATVEENEQISPGGQVVVVDVEMGMASPAGESETLVHDETQTAISVAAEQAVDASSPELNEGSGGSVSVVLVPDVPPVVSSGPSRSAEQIVSEPVELETSAGQSEAHNSQRMVGPEVGQAAREIGNPNPIEGESSEITIMDPNAANLS